MAAFCAASAAFPAEPGTGGRVHGSDDFLYFYGVCSVQVHGGDNYGYGGGRGIRRQRSLADKHVAYPGGNLETAINKHLVLGTAEVLQRLFISSYGLFRCFCCLEWIVSPPPSQSLNRLRRYRFNRHQNKGISSRQM